MEVLKKNVMVDAVIIEDESLVLIKRRNEPFKDMWALPGGFINANEKVEDAVIREAEEETGLKVRIKEPVGVYSKPNRDPRGESISIVFLCEITGGKLNAGDDAKEAKKFSLKKLPHLAFDHEKIIYDVVSTDLYKKVE